MGIPQKMLLTSVHCDLQVRFYYLLDILLLYICYRNYATCQKCNIVKFPADNGNTSQSNKILIWYCGFNTFALTIYWQQQVCDHSNFKPILIVLIHLYTIM
jgi:hypothetical protein